LIKEAFFEQQKVCPVCKTKFTITRIRSSACMVQERETDFHVKYRDVDPLLYSIWVCPNCQYASSDKDFETDFKPQEMERLKKGLPMLKSEEPDFSSQRVPQTALRTFELGLRTAMIKQSPAIVVAGLYLRAAWMYREMGKKEEEINYIEQARKLYQHSFEKEWGRYAAKMSDSRIMYLIGELYHRCGDYEEAIKWFSRTVMNKDIKKEPEINRLVRAQWETAREGYKAQQGGKVSSQAADNGQKEVTPEKAPDKPEEIIEKPPQPKSRGSKVKMFVSLYMDQVEWLKVTANKPYEKHKVFLGKESVARAVIDAVMEKIPDPGKFKSEEELKQMIMNKISG